MKRFQWQKLGLVFAPDGRFDWMQTHAQNPSVLVMEDRLRVYFTCRPKPDEKGRFTSVTTFVDVGRKDPRCLLYVHDRPILSLGGPGTFDQFGVMPGPALRVGNEVWLYYVGWSRCEGVPYNHAIGLAISTDGGRTFTRYADGPVIARSPQEPFIQNSPDAMIANDGFRMWYSSGIEWIKHEGRWESIYVLMQATSADGVRWARGGQPCMPTLTEHEVQTNPTVIRLDGLYYMWFCYRNGLDFRNADGGYRIGHAWSEDGSNWNRDDAHGRLDRSNEGWDSEMVCYPRVVNLDGRLLMFYSGNYFGRDGFGVARRSPASPTTKLPGR